MKTCLQVKKRILGLDILRFVAVVLVLGHHLRIEGPNESWLLQAWQRGGWVGVDIFFVLSGFLVSGLLFDEFKRTARIDGKRFLIRRAWKIYPAFWVMISFTLVMRAALGWPDWGATANATLAEMLFVQNYFRGLWAHTWTLGVEEHFYIALAIFCALIASRGRGSFREIPIVFIGLAVMCFVLRGVTMYALRSEQYDWFRYCGTHLHIDSLFCGVTISYACHFGGLQTKLAGCPSLLLIVGGVLGLLPVFVLEEVAYPPAWAITVISNYLASALLLLAAIRLQFTTNRAARAVASIGAASYSIYLWHAAVNSWGTQAVFKILGFSNDGLYLATYLLGSLVWGMIMARMVESPVLALRERWFPSHRVQLQRETKSPLRELQTDLPMA